MGLLAAASSVATGLAGLGQWCELERLSLVVVGGSLAAVLSALTLADEKKWLYSYIGGLGAVRCLSEATARYVYG